MPRVSDNAPDAPHPSATSIHLIRVSLGLIYFHFGFLKFYPDLSPAEVLAGYTSQRLTAYLLDASTVMLIVAVLECVIGLGFLFNVCLRVVGVLFTFHMAATFLPLFLLPEFSYRFVPFAPTIEGQYILKNLVLVSAGWAVLAPHFRGIRLPRRRKNPAVPSGEQPHQTLA